MADKNTTRLRVTSLKLSDVGRCPNYIFGPEHYREDGTCRCNDPGATVMREWGYRWNKKKNQWESES
jgi:hypothetical protein